MNTVEVSESENGFTVKVNGKLVTSFETLAPYYFSSYQTALRAGEQRSAR